MEKQEVEQKPVVFWYARVLGDTIFNYHMIMDEEEADLPTYEADGLLKHGLRMKYSMFCLN